MHNIPKDQRAPYGPARNRRPKKDRSVAASRSRQGDRDSGDDEDADEKPRKFLTGPQVCTRYSISDMSLWRWLQDPVLNFPQPSLVVRRHRFWDEAVLRVWELQKIVRPPAGGGVSGQPERKQHDQA